MRKAFLLMLWTILSTITRAQSFVGEHRDSIEYYLSHSGYEYKLDTNQNGELYISSWIDDRRMRAWYFKNERCVVFILLHPVNQKDSILKRLERSFRRIGDKYYDNRTKIVWEMELSEEVVLLSAKKYD